MRKELSFCRKTGIPILGIVENMSGFVCPNCTVSQYPDLYIVMPCTGLYMQECTNVFSTGGGESLAKLCSVPFLGRSTHAGRGGYYGFFFNTGRVPLDPRLTQCVEEGKSFAEVYHDTPAQKAMTDIVDKLLVQS